MSIVGKVVESYFPGGYLEVDNGHVTKIIEKPTPGTEPSNLVNLLIHYHPDPAALFAALGQIVNGDEYEEGGLQTLFDQGVVAQVMEYSDTWHAIKYPWHLLDVMHHFLQNLQQPKVCLFEIPFLFFLTIFQQQYIFF